MVAQSDIATAGSLQASDRAPALAILRSKDHVYEILALLALISQQGWLLPLSEGSARSLGFGVLLLAAALLRLFTPLWLGVGFALLAAVLHRFAPEPVRFTHLMVNVALLAALVVWHGRPRPALLLSGTLLSSWAALEHALPGVMLPISSASYAVSARLSGLLDTAANVGPTYLGLVPAITLGAYVSTACARGRAWWHGALLFCGFAGLWLFLALLLNKEITNLLLWVRFHLPLAAAGHAHHSHQDPWLMGMVPLVLSLATLAASGFFRRREEALGSRSSRIVPHAMWMGLTGLAGLVVGAAYWGQSANRIPRRDIVLYEKGVLDWRLPKQEGPFGVGRSGMFGQFEVMLERLGLQRRHASSLEALPPAGEAILVIINPTEMTEADASRIEAFVRAGGGLLVLGDHTDLEGIAAPLNRTLAFAGASFRFDSAFAARRTWRNVYRRSSHPLAEGLGSSNEALQQGTGASLALAGLTWQPVVSGQYAFSDRGNRLRVKEGFLGDYAYQPGEFLGDLPVVAVRQVGAGRVAVFGDTSAFQNLAVPRSAELIHRVLCYLGTSPGRWSVAGPWCAAGAALLLTILVRHWTALGAFALAAFMALAIQAWRRDADFCPPLAPGSAQVAAIDATHFGAFTLEHFKVNSVDGLFNTLMRNNYWPAAVTWPCALHEVDAEVYVLIAPMNPLDRTELERLLDRGKGGATLIVATGFEESRGAGPLLAALDMEIGPDPLGPVPLVPRLEDPEEFQRLRDAPHFTEAWPLKWRGPAWQSFYEWKGHHIVAARRWGKGRVIVIGDSRFLLDETLETESDSWPGNIRFFQAMLATWPPERVDGNLPALQDKDAQ